EDRACLPQNLDDSIAPHTLREILVRRPDADLLDALLRCRCACGRCQGVVRLELDHRPDSHAHCPEGLLQGNELAPQGRFDAFARLVAWPKPVTKRLDDVVGADADMGRALLD